MKETWIDIPEFEGYYQVSSLGRIKSFHKNKNGVILSVKNSKGWYLSISLCKGKIRRTYKIHQLVAQCFLPNPNGKIQINHIDMNKQNNIVDNLEWVTCSENMKHASETNPSFLKGMIKRNQFINPKRIRQFDFDGNFIAEYANARIASNLTGVCHRNILQVAHKEEYKPGKIRKQAGGYYWEMII